MQKENFKFLGEGLVFSVINYAFFIFKKSRGCCLNNYDSLFHNYENVLKLNNDLQI